MTTKILIEELRDKACNSKGYERELCNQAADEIEKLTMDLAIHRGETIGIIYPMRWIDKPIYKVMEDGTAYDGYTFCDNCEHIEEYGHRSKYCPHCGAKMEGEE